MKHPLLACSLIAMFPVLGARSSVAQQFGSQELVTPFQDYPVSVAAADFDGDGDIDALAGSRYDDRVAWYENMDGQGTFLAFPHIITTQADGTDAVFAADIDGDGDQDALSASRYDDKVAWYENTDGQGTFGPQRVISTQADRAHSVFAADLDGDGDLDVLSASLQDDKVAWYENTDGLGEFGPQHVISSTADGARSTIAADLDGDGDLDVVSASSSDNKVAWYENANGGNGFEVEHVVTTLAAGAEAVCAADLDDDGDQDLVSASSADDKIAWYDNANGAGAFGAQRVVSTAAEHANSVFVADVDGDSDLDILSASGFSSPTDKIAWYENADGSASFGPQQPITGSVMWAESVYAADIDGDGDLDVFSASSYDDKIAWYENLSGQISSCAGVKPTLPAGSQFDHIGSALAANGVFVLAGLSSFDGPGFESGAAALAYRNGYTWVALQLILPTDSSPSDLFGHSVGLSGERLLIGARGASSQAGAAYVFYQKADGSWAQETKLVADDAQAGDWLGSRVGIDGDIAAVAALHADPSGSNSGAAYVFRKTAGAWSQQQKLVASDGAAGDEFGKGLAISASRILVGANGNDDAGADSGSAYVFDHDASQEWWWQSAKLVAADAAPGAQFGNEVALDGDVAVVSARGANGVGAVYVFRRSGFAWTQEQKLTASTPLASAEFGSAVDIVGDHILVGARLDDSAAYEGGAAYLFEFDGATWTQTAKYTLPEAAPGDHLGSAVALSSGYAIVGAEWADDPALDSGELWAFPLPDTCQPQITSVQPTSAQFPEVVTAQGLLLGQTQSVVVDGVPASLIGATDFSVTFQPQPGAPGDVPLEAIGPDGTAVTSQRLYPALTASTTGVGGTLHVEIDNGDVGLYVLALGLGSLPSPIPIASPQTWHGVLLNPLGPLFTIGTGAFATGEPVKLVYPVASNPALSGLPIHLQAWCQQEFFGPDVTYSFTNMASVAL